MRKHEISLIADPIPEQALFVRSDQYSLVKKGIPAVCLKPGAQESGADGSTNAHDSFRRNHYHMPSDDLNLRIDYEWAAKFVEIKHSIYKSLPNLIICICKMAEALFTP